MSEPLPKRMHVQHGPTWRERGRIFVRSYCGVQVVISHSLSSEADPEEWLMCINCQARKYGRIVR